jgi:hypothetical protein
MAALNLAIITMVLMGLIKLNMGADTCPDGNSAVVREFL